MEGGSSDRASATSSASNVFGMNGISDNVVALIAVGLLILLTTILATRKQ